MLQVHIPVWIPGRRGEDCDQQEGDDVQVRLHVHHNIASSTVNIDIAVTMSYQHHQSTLHHVSFKAKSTIINMTMSKMNYIYSNKKPFPKNFQLGREHCEGAPTSWYAGLGRRLFFKGELSSLPQASGRTPVLLLKPELLYICVVQGWLPWFYHNFQLFFSALS